MMAGYICRKEDQMYKKILKLIREIVDDEELEIEISIAQMETLAEAIAEMVMEEFAEHINVIRERIEEVFIDE
jgi:esterase/lipase